MSLFSEKDVDSFKADRLMALAATYAPDVEASDSYLLGQIRAAEREVSRLLKVQLEPTRVFPREPSEEDLAALPEGMPWVEDPATDFDPSFFRGERWGFIITDRRPVLKVHSIRFVYPSPYAAFYTIPKDWIRLDKRQGHIRLVPASAAWSAPLNAFLMQAMGGGSIIPGMIQVDYDTGLSNALEEWPDLVDVIFKKAALKVLEGMYLPQSASISADGLSQSVSVDASKYRDLVDETLFGPKGSNAGLFSAIHGLQLGILG